MSTAYAPPSESLSDLWIERSNLDGSVLAGVSYGIHFTLFLIAVSLLLKQRKQRNDWGFLLFTVVMFVLGTIFIGANTKMNELSFIDNRNFPGGPTAYLSSNYNTPVNVLGNTVFVISNWLADGLLMYRCLLIYNFRYWIMVLPTSLYLGSIGMGILVLFETGIPQSNLWTALSIKFTTAYFSLSLAINVGLTLLISIRIFIYRQRTRKSLGPEYGTQYTSILAMLVESSALYSAFNILFLVTYTRQSPVQNLFLPVLGNIQMISPLLIIIRVALGSGWTRNTGTLVTGADIEFKQPAKSANGSGRQFTATSTNTVTAGLGNKGQVLYPS